MQQPTWKQWNTRSRLAFYGKCCAVAGLFLFSILMVACGGGANGLQANLTDPAVTVTIDLGKQNGTPLPPPKDYWCGAWATNTTPSITTATQVGIYAKFTHNVNGNPEGVGGAAAIATVSWADGQIQTVPATTNTTTSDGLAVFSIPLDSKRTNLVGRLTLVTVTFSKPGVPDCVVNADRAAFFTLVMSSPTATPTSQNPTPPDQATSTPFPWDTPGVTPTVRPRRTPTPTATP